MVAKYNNMYSFKIPTPHCEFEFLYKPVLKPGHLQQETNILNFTICF